MDTHRKYMVKPDYIDRYKRDRQIGRKTDRCIDIYTYIQQGDLQTNKTENRKRIGRYIYRYMYVIQVQCRDWYRLKSGFWDNSLQLDM